MAAGNKPFGAYEQESWHGGVNLRGNRLDIREIDSTELTNGDISIEGRLSKRLEPEKVCVLKASPTNHINGGALFVNENGVALQCWTLDGRFYTWDGVAGHAATEYRLTPPVSGGPSYIDLHTTNRIRFAQARRTTGAQALYGVDGFGYLFRFDGTTLQALTSATGADSITASSVYFKNAAGTTIATTNADGNIKVGATTVGAINYTSGEYYLTDTSAFDLTLPYYATYSYGIARNAEWLGRASQAGKLQYPAVSQSGLYSITLTDGANVVLTNGSNLEKNSVVVGTVNLDTGEFQVTTAGTFTPKTTITAEVLPTGAGGEIVSGEDHGTVPVGGNPDPFYLTTYPFVPSGLVVNVGGYLLADNGVGQIYDQATMLIPHGNCTYADGWVDLSGLEDHVGATITAAYTSSGHRITTNELVGTSDADGKLYQIKLANIPAVGGNNISISDGVNTVVSDADNNLTKGASTVGTWNPTTGVISVTVASTFSAGGSVNINYSTTTSVTMERLGSPASGTLNPSANTIAARDILFSSYNRLFIGKGDDLYFSDALDPDTFSQLPTGVGSSSGGDIYRIMEFSEDTLLVWKRVAGGLGSVHYLNVAATDPADWIARLVRGGMTFQAPYEIVRADAKDRADVYMNTGDGYRSLKFTVSTDRPFGLTPPFDWNIASWRNDLSTDPDVIDKSWAVLFNDEILRWRPKQGSTLPDVVHAFNMKVRRTGDESEDDAIQRGWTKIDMAEADLPESTVIADTGVTHLAAFCGFVADMGDGAALYVGSTTGGQVVKMFSRDTSIFKMRVVSKGITMGEGDRPSKFLDLAPWKLTVRVDENSHGKYTVKLKADNGDEYSLGEFDLDSTTPRQFIRSFPCQYGEDKFENQSQIPTSKDWRVVIETYDPINFDGFQLICGTKPQRFTGVEEDLNPAITADDYEQEVIREKAY